MRKIIALVVLATMIAPPVMAQDATPVGTPIAEIAPEQDGIYVTDPALYTARPDGPFEQGKPGAVAVVGSSDTTDDGVYLIVLRNNTSAMVNSIEVTGSLTDDGEVVALGVETVVRPVDIPPGGLGFMFIQLKGDLSRAVLRNEPDFIVTQATNVDSPALYNVRVASAIVGEDQAVIALTAPQTSFSDGISVLVMCFTDPTLGQVRMETWSSDAADLDIQLRRGGAATITLDSPPGCGETFLVAALGY